MDQESVLDFLVACFADFCIHPELIGEIATLMAESGNEGSFFNLLIARLKFLSSLGINATRHKEFELIGSGIYSMHLSGNGFNIRILYGFLPNRKPALLLSFYEREGKRATNYTPYLAPAKQRLTSLKEEYLHG